jgi:hypothetical protein
MESSHNNSGASNCAGRDLAPPITSEHALECDVEASSLDTALRRALWRRETSRGGGHQMPNDHHASPAYAYVGCRCGSSGLVRESAENCAANA